LAIHRASVRAWGKLDIIAGHGIIWIDNANDAWKKVADGVTISIASAVLMVSGLPNGTYDLSWQNTHNGSVSAATQSVSNGTLSLTVTNLQHDVAMIFKWR
jgi:hypothetical protein